MVKKVTNVNAPSWQVGDGVYLAWSMLDDNQRLQHSKHRLTKGEVIEVKHGQGVQYGIAVRFNGDPEHHWFKRLQLSQTPEME